MKNALITGGSRGIGRATALRCAAQGWSVALNYARNEQAAQQAVTGAAKLGAKALAIRGDISSEKDVIAMFDKADADLGPLTGVVLNAGIVAQTMPLADMSADRLKNMFDVNVYGTYLCAREAARRLQPDSAIVIVSSMASRLGSPFEYVDYAGAKGALDTLTTGLSKELAPKGIRVNAVRPGLIDTEIHASGGNPDRAARLGAETPAGRAGKAEEVAEAIFWLLNDAPAYVTGTFIDVAGGR
ncbi:SDR family oxidoreductase [Brucella tritici]|uniref:SDR family oxidoreductase n=1 Tax=Brucella tritici TaxID=94626 RepID=A0A6N6QKI6_9HYPH|nr:SDR family oxidoreductase [Brucella tritici]KAB2664617.1 SDR family oxidoreductase [Brucella tritici]KAB2678639.1 SDR family oxidoreductase [Brucella tritici]KAB2686014.1 SDR family oxidoreductase [Brucella tritici]